MSDPTNDEEDLKPTLTAGYKLGEKKTVDEYAQLDANDESLNRWKASLGITPGSSSATGPKLTVYSLRLTSPTLPEGKTIEFNIADTEALEGLKKNPIVIKEGVEYSVGATFNVNHDVVSGLRYMQVVKRAGLKVDKLESMLGSYGPSKDGKPYERSFHAEVSPDGMLARSGTYSARSRFTDDDGEVYADFTWTFKIGKEW